LEDHGKDRLIVVLLTSPLRTSSGTSWPGRPPEARPLKNCGPGLLQQGPRGLPKFEAGQHRTRRSSPLQQHVCAKIDQGGRGTTPSAKLPAKRLAADDARHDPDGKLHVDLGAQGRHLRGHSRRAKPAYFDKILPAREALARDASQADKLVTRRAYVKLNNDAEGGGSYGKAVDIW
jgi:hypothetical protein